MNKAAMKIILQKFIFRIILIKKLNGFVNFYHFKMFHITLYSNINYQS